MSEQYWIWLAFSLGMGCQYLVGLACATRRRKRREKASKDCIW